MKVWNGVRACVRTNVVACSVNCVVVDYKTGAPYKKRCVDWTNVRLCTDGDVGAVSCSVSRSIADLEKDDLVECARRIVNLEL